MQAIFLYFRCESKKRMRGRIWGMFHVKHVVDAIYFSFYNDADTGCALRLEVDKSLKWQLWHVQFGRRGGVFGKDYRGR